MAAVNANRTRAIECLGRALELARNGERGSYDDYRGVYEVDALVEEFVDEMLVAAEESLSKR